LLACSCDLVFLVVWERTSADRSSIEVKDISLTDYINVNHAVYVPHTAGRYAKKQFAKGRMPIVERLVNA
jgi:small subunit ribosomal protein S5e